MGFHPQPNDWSCGPVALEHALITLGQIADPDELARLAGTHWWRGTDEVGLGRAARANDCTLELVRKRNPQSARRALLGFLREGIPVLLCVDGWEHWISVLNYERDNFVVVDSLADPVLQVVSWPALHRRWRYLDTDYDEEEPPSLYEMYPVRPNKRRPMLAKLTVDRVRYLTRTQNRDLALHWHEYLEDLLTICKPPSPHLRAKTTIAELLRRHQNMIVGRVEYWHGDVPRRTLERFLHNFRFVGETYGLVIPASQQRQAVADLAVLTTMWAIAHAGAPTMYGVEPP